MARLGMPLRPRNSLVDFLFPHDGTVGCIQGVELQRVLGVIFVRANVSRNAGLEGGVARATDGRRDIDPVSPDDRAAIGKTGYRSLPQDILSSRHIPLDDRTLAIPNTRCIGSAE